MRRIDADKLHYRQVDIVSVKDNVQKIKSDIVVFAKEIDKMPVIPAFPDQDDDFGAVINCAIRYCLGRYSYMPGVIIDWIMKCCDGRLTDRTIYCAKSDIDSAATDGCLDKPDDIRQEWKLFRRWLDKQPCKWEYINKQEVWYG